MFGAVQITEVEPGTVVGKDAAGNDMVVTDDAVVTKGNRMWVTPKVFSAIKAKTVVMGQAGEV